MVNEVASTFWYACQPLFYNFSGQFLFFFRKRARIANLLKNKRRIHSPKYFFFFWKRARKAILLKYKRRIHNPKIQTTKSKDKTNT